MAREGALYACQACGAVHSKWAGRCDACGEWNTIIEEVGEPRAVATKTGKVRAGRITFAGLEGQAEPPPRASTGIAELDRVLGGGLVPGAAILLAGEPGVGKTRLAREVLDEAGRRFRSTRCRGSTVARPASATGRAVRMRPVLRFRGSAWRNGKTARRSSRAGQVRAAGMTGARPSLQRLRRGSAGRPGSGSGAGQYARAPRGTRTANRSRRCVPTSL